MRQSRESSDSKIFLKRGKIGTDGDGDGGDGEPGQ